MKPNARRAAGLAGGSWSRRVCLLLLALLIAASLELNRHGAQARNVHRRVSRNSVRLCSRSLSDALELLCKERGYNELFSDNGDSGIRLSPGPGLVQECCHNTCTIDEMEQYCKPAKKQY